MNATPARRLRPAASYLRMSTDNQRYSLESQAALIADYAAVAGFEVVKSYVDAGRSGVTTAGRLGLKELLNDVLAGETPYSTILVLDVSRWGRFQDPDEAAHYEFLCREAGVRVEYCAEAFANDGSTSSSIIKSLKRVMAAEYSRQLSDRCSAGKRRQVAKGCFVGGVPPYGARRRVYNSDGSAGPLLQAGERRPRLDQTVRLVRGPPSEIKATRLIFRLFGEEAWSLGKIAQLLNARGETFTRGELWTCKRVRCVLSNELARGYTVYNKATGQFANPGVFKPASEWLRVRILTPIVTAVLFNSVQERLASLSGGAATEGALLENLRSLWMEHGYLSSRLIDRHGMVKACTYAERFGRLSWAYARIGYTIGASQGSLADEYILRRVRALFDAHGYLSTQLLIGVVGIPPPNYLARRFGSLQALYQRVGFCRSPAELATENKARRALRRAERASLKRLLRAPVDADSQEADPAPSAHTARGLVSRAP